jgi:hypothetical protein
MQTFLQARFTPLSPEEVHLKSPDPAALVAKVARADETLAGLSQALDKFVTENFRIERKVRVADSKYEFRAFGDAILPMRASVLVGEIVHHLRSTLDHLVTQLAAIGPGNGNPNKLEFPIYTDPQGFKDACKRGKIKGVSDEAAKLIESVQPYNAFKPAEQATLWLLHDLDRIDKHRLPLVVVAAIQMASELRFDGKGNLTVTGMTPPTPVGTRPSSHGTVIFEVDLGLGFNPALDIQGDFGLQVVFPHLGPLRDIPVLKTLTIMRELVVTHLGQFFPEIVQTAA